MVPEYIYIAGGILTAFTLAAGTLIVAVAPKGPDIHLAKYLFVAAAVLGEVTLVTWGIITPAKWPLRDIMLLIPSGGLGALCYGVWVWAGRKATEIGHVL
jgi:hypothetical protein